MPPLAVLFDFDGVIADTENIISPPGSARLPRSAGRHRMRFVRAAVEIDDRDFPGRDLREAQNR